MRITTKSFLVALAFGVITFVLFDAAITGSGWGFAMGLGSLFALFVIVRLLKKLALLESEEEQSI